MKLSELSALVDGQFIGQDSSFDSISTDSRNINPGELFIAVAGDQFDGHNFVAQAQMRGAVAALVSQDVVCEIPLIKVSDTRKALGQLAAKRREQFPIPLIALTGSCGKTTTKEMLRSILSVCGETLANIKSFNNDLGVPLTLLQLTSQHQYAVIEMGANHPGEIAYLTQLAKPNVALITNIAPAHLQGFGSIEGVAKAKSEIFNSLTAAGTAIINADDNFADWLKDVLKNRTIWSFGVRNKADFYTKEIGSDDTGRFSFVLCSPQGEIDIKLPLAGQHNVMNALTAAAASMAVGATLPAIKQGLEQVSPVPGRLVIRQGRVGACVIDDTYNANPASVAAALQVLSQRSGERIFVFGGMGELGDNAGDYHKQIGELAKQLRIERVYTCGELAKLAAEAFGNHGYHFANQEELVNELQNILQPEMTILVKGSRSTKMEKVVAALIE